MTRALITTVPFGEADPAALVMLDAAGIEYVINPLGHQPTEQELVSLAPGFDVLIAGTGPITDRVMEAAPQLRLISRVGVGLDSVDLLAARERGITVAYTPEGPADAVAELTIGLALSLLRGVHLANTAIRQGVWKRIQGRRLAQVTVGVVGVGRIGRRVIRLLLAFGARILANDLAPVALDEPVRWVDKPTLYREADLVTLHVPLTRLTRSLIGAEELAMMHPGAFLINTCRGGVVSEAALAAALRDSRIAGAAIDTFTDEPYRGELVQLDTCLITAHMGSMSVDCRANMECGAARNVVAFLRGEPLDELVPESEYALRAS
ncbi:MAG: phosphoglycerate dehydrogenase [Vicinamibacterales bacterium]|nr:phosphoglycerate dehydrogenase [Vicinamibacterales bacterium]